MTRIIGKFEFIGLHYWYSLKHKNASTVEERKLIEREQGVRYSPLIDLPYFDSILFNVIDPMHLLFLGISKYTLKKFNILSEQRFMIIQERVDSFKTPSLLGHIPFKIASGFSGFSADQWKNWSLYFLLYRPAIPQAL